MRSLSLLALCCFSTVSFAADVPGSQDLQIVPRLADAQIVDYRPPAEQERIYPLGSIRKISGQFVRIERAEADALRSLDAPEDGA